MSFPQNVIILSSPYIYSRPAKKILLTKESNLEVAAEKILKELQLDLEARVLEFTFDFEEEKDYLLDSEDSSWFQDSIFEGLDVAQIQADLSRELESTKSSKYRCSLNLYGFMFNWVRVRFSDELNKGLPFLNTVENRKIISEKVLNFEAEKGETVDLKTNEKLIRDTFNSILEEMKYLIPALTNPLEEIGYFSELTKQFNKCLSEKKKCYIFIHHADNLVFVD